MAKRKPRTTLIDHNGTPYMVAESYSTMKNRLRDESDFIEYTRKMSRQWTKVTKRKKTIDEIEEYDPINHDVPF